MLNRNHHILKMCLLIAAGPCPVGQPSRWGFQRLFCLETPVQKRVCYVTGKHRGQHGKIWMLRLGPDTDTPQNGKWVFEAGEDVLFDRGWGLDQLMAAWSSWNFIFCTCLKRKQFGRCYSCSTVMNTGRCSNFAVLTSRDVGHPHHTCGLYCSAEQPSDSSSRCSSEHLSILHAWGSHVVMNRGGTCEMSRCNTSLPQLRQTSILMCDYSSAHTGYHIKFSGEMLRI